MPFDGKAFGAEIAGMVRDHVAAALAPLYDEIEHLKAQLDYLAMIPGPAGAPGEAGAPGKDGADGRDGVGLAGALIDHDGNLAVTLSDGTVQTLGAVVGRDGADGAPGKDGERGAPGFGLDDFDTEMPNDRTIVFKFIRDDIAECHEFQFATILDRGVWKEGVTYEKGDAVTFGGSLFIAQAETTERPETGPGWRLAVKRGRDGKDGAQGKEGPQGRPGERGRDGWNTPT